MRIMAIILSMMTLQGIMSPTNAQIRIDGDWNSPKCIDVIWERTNPNEEEKLFDVEHDLDINGTRYSCRGEITASEVNNAFSTVKNAIASNDKMKVAENSVYPFSYWIDTEELTEYGYKKPREVENIEEFIDKFDEIFNPKIRKIFACGNIDNLDNYGGGTVVLATGLIFFSKEPDNNKEIVRNFYKYPMRLSSIGHFAVRHDRWFDEHCK